MWVFDVTQIHPHLTIWAKVNTWVGVQVVVRDTGALMGYGTGSLKIVIL
jgi:hypothetical protein